MKVREIIGDLASYEYDKTVYIRMSKTDDIRSIQDIYEDNAGDPYFKSIQNTGRSLEVSQVISGLMNYSPEELVWILNKDKWYHVWSVYEDDEGDIIIESDTDEC